MTGSFLTAPEAIRAAHCWLEKAFTDHSVFLAFLRLESLMDTWSADGRAILYATLRGAASKLWSQPLDGGAPKQLADFNPDQLFSFALSSDGRQLAFARGTVSRDIILITDSR